MWVLLSIFLLTATPAVAAPAVAVPEVQPVVAVCFTPGGDCDTRLVELIDSAQKTIRVAAYTLTSEPIADALIRARQRNIKVWVVLDRGQWWARGGQGHRLRGHGVGVRYDCDHQLMHNKYVVVDILHTATGSYNFSDAAQRRNAENMLILRDRPTAQSYADNWGWHWSHSVRVPESGAAEPSRP